MTDTVLKILMRQLRSDAEVKFVHPRIVKLVNEYLPSDSLLSEDTDLRPEELWVVINLLPEDVKLKLVSTAVDLSDGHADHTKLLVIGGLALAGLLIFGAVYEPGNGQELLDTLLPFLKELIEILKE